jgi:hypothetical protein
VFGIVYALCAGAALFCAWLLLRSYSKTRSRLLLWSGLCFVGLFVNNLLVIMDLFVFPQIDLSIARLVAALVGMGLLLYGLIWEAE